MGFAARGDADIAYASVAPVMFNGESDEARSHANVAQTLITAEIATILDRMGTLEVRDRLTIAPDSERCN